MKYEEVVKATNEVIAGYTIRLTVRQIYYRIISPPYQLFANTMNNYKAFDKMLTRAREEGEVPWRRIEDRSRSTIGGDFGYDSPDSFLSSIIIRLETCYEDYTEKMWENQPKYVEVWVEKDALATLVSSVARRFAVLTYPSRGYSSFTRIMEAVEDRFDERPEGQEVIVLHFSDHDPSGLDMTRDIEDRIRKYNVDEFGNSPPFEVIRYALTHDQVKQFNLAPNPTKQADPRAKDYVAQYGDECWELDALDPKELQRVIEEAIKSHIDAAKWSEKYEAIKEAQEKLHSRLARAVIEIPDE